MRRLKEAETQKRKKNKRISVDTSKAFVFEGHSPFRHICRFGIEMTMEIEVNRKHPEWTFRYKCKVFLLLPNVSRAMSNVKTSQKVNLNAGIGAKVKITHRHTQRRRTYTQRQKNEGNSPISWVRQSFTWENIEPFSKKFSRKMQLLFFWGKKRGFKETAKRVTPSTLMV